MSLVPVKEFTTIADMRAARQALRAKFFTPRPAPKPVVVVEPEPPAPIVKPDYIRDWLTLASPEAIKPASSRKIISMVADAFGVSHLDIVGDRRFPKIVIARQVCFYLMRECTGLSFPEIARRVGDRDHTTALHGANKIAKLIQSDRDLHAAVTTMMIRVRAEIRQ